MFKEVLAYVKERCPILFLLALSLVLFSANLNFKALTLEAFLSGYLSAFGLLFLIRLSDDICDIPVDRITHPQRVLCQPNLSLRPFNILRLVTALVLLALQPTMTATVFIATVLLLGSLFFWLKPRLPTLIHVALLNTSLALFPLYADFLTQNTITLQGTLIGVFFWFGGIAHDFSHSVQDTRHVDRSLLNPLNQINQRLLAKLALVFFVLTYAIGVVISTTFSLGVGFIVSLSILFCFCVYLNWKLILTPNEKLAKPFYVLGFALFLVPCLVAQSELWLMQ